VAKQLQENEEKINAELIGALPPKIIYEVLQKTGLLLTR